MSGKHIASIPALFVLISCLSLVSCIQEETTEQHSLVEVSPPVGPGARFPFLTSAGNHDSILMSWQEADSDSTKLLWASFDGQGWSDPELIKQSEGFFVNWADFPSLVTTAEAPLAAHWLQKVEGSTYAYHVNLSFRSEAGQWSDAITPHRDRSAGEHGFVSMLPLEDGQVFLTWLDGHQTGQGMPMTLHSALVSENGSVMNELEVDGMVCDCCQTSAARSGNSIIVIYRDRSEGEIRDTSGAIYDLELSRWSDPFAISDEGWEIAGCPVNGPQIAAHGEIVIATWFTAAKHMASSYMSVSIDGGHNWSASEPIHVGETTGRVGVAINRAGDALMTWVEMGQEKSAVHGRFWQPGKLGEAFKIGEIESSRSSGFPRLAAIGDDFIVAWTEPELDPGIRIVRVAVE